FSISLIPAAFVFSMPLVTVSGRPRISKPPLVPIKRIWFRVNAPMLFVLTEPGCGPWKRTVSPFAGVPAPPQLLGLLQLASGEPPPDQLKTFAATRLGLKQKQVNNVKTKQMLRMTTVFGRDCNFCITVSSEENGLTTGLTTYGWNVLIGSRR